MNVCLFSCLDNLLVGGIKLSVCDIFSYSSVKKEYILRYNSNIFSEALKLNISYINSVESNCARIDVIKSRDKIAKSAFSSAGRADKRKSLSRLYLKVQIL